MKWEYWQQPRVPKYIESEIANSETQTRASKSNRTSASSRGERNFQGKMNIPILNLYNL